MKRIIPKVRDHLKKALNTPLSKEALVLHGDTIVSVIEALSTGYFPNGSSGSFYATPITENLEKSKYNIPLVKWEIFSYENAIKDSIHYAGCHTAKQILESELGYFPEELMNMDYDDVEGLISVLSEDENLDVFDPKIMDIIQRITAYKGLIIQPNENIFELFCEKGDEKSTLRFTNSKGIPYDCIQSIEPLTVLERNTLDILLNSH